VTDQTESPNEIVAAARDAERQREAARPAAKRRNWPLAAVGLGIGSTAVAAAVLYARSRED